MEEGGRRLEMKTSEGREVFFSEVFRMSRASSSMGTARQRVEMERSKRRHIILALLQRICDREISDLCSTLNSYFSTFNLGFVRMFLHLF